MKAVIIAAGCGSRLEDKHKGMPKSLLEYKGVRLIDNIIGKLVKSGIEEIIMITGYKSEMIEGALSNYANGQVRIHFKENQEWTKPNGISVLCAKEFMEPGEKFLLLMSDHLFQHSILENVIQTQIGELDSLLAIDKKIDNIPDLDDGMKLSCQHLSGELYDLVKFDKQLTEYQAIDCGIFKFDFHVFSILENNIQKGKCSLSDACNELCAQGHMKGMDIGDQLWIDMDTPEMFECHQILEKVF